jgi:hypothetical protein
VTPYLWIFTIFDAGALLLVACELTARPQPVRPHPRRLNPAFAVVLLLASYAAQLLLTAYVEAHQALPLPHPLLVPLPPVAGEIPYADLVAALWLCVAAAQTALLLALYRHPPRTRTVLVGAALLTAIAWSAPVIFSGDAYAYIGDGLLGLAAYAPPAVRFHGDLAAINAWWGVPLPRTVYGPLWIAAVGLVTAPFATLAGKFFALRVLGVLTYGGLLLALRALGAPRRIVTVAALDPAIFFNYVTNAHNDLFGIVAILFAAAIVRRRPAVAFVLMTAGALVKLPFALFALPVLGAVRSVPVRFAAGIGIAVAAGALTWLAGGTGFLRAAQPHVLTNGVALLSTAAVALAAAAALLVAAANGRRLRSAAWLMPLATAFTCPWYLAWSLPYAVASRRVLGYLLVGFPLAAAAIDVKFMRPWTLFAVVPLLVAWQAFELRGTPRKAAA